MIVLPRVRVPYLDPGELLPQDRRVGLCGQGHPGEQSLAVAEEGVLFRNVRCS